MLKGQPSACSGESTVSKAGDMGEFRDRAGKPAGALWDVARTLTFTLGPLRGLRVQQANSGRHSERTLGNEGRAQEPGNEVGKSWPRGSLGRAARSLSELRWIPKGGPSGVLKDGAWE